MQETLESRCAALEEWNQEMRNNGHIGGFSLSADRGWSKRIFDLDLCGDSIILSTHRTLDDSIS